MPCYEVRTMSVEFKAKYFSLLKKAIESLGWTYVGITRDLELEVKMGLSGSFKVDLLEQNAKIQSSQRSQLNQLKQQYSKEALKRAAKLQGWQYKQQKQQKGVLRK